MRHRRSQFTLSDFDWLTSSSTNQAHRWTHPSSASVALSGKMERCFQHPSSASVCERSDNAGSRTVRVWVKSFTVTDLRLTLYGLFSRTTIFLPETCSGNTRRYTRWSRGRWLVNTFPSVSARAAPESRKREWSKRYLKRKSQWERSRLFKNAVSLA